MSAQRWVTLHKRNKIRTLETAQPFIKNKTKTKKQLVFICVAPKLLLSKTVQFLQRNNYR